MTQNDRERAFCAAWVRDKSGRVDKQEIDKYNALLFSAFSVLLNGAIIANDSRYCNIHSIAGTHLYVSTDSGD